MNTENICEESYQHNIYNGDICFVSNWSLFYWYNADYDMHM